jgi:LysR family glycine cleavage system transcriptional activator
MKRELPPLSWLRAFEASARHLSFTNAASELNLTQAAVSKQVKLLEQHLREPLFHRRPRSLALTKAAEAFMPKVRDAFDRLESGTKEVFGKRHNEVLTIRVAVGFSINWLAPRLPSFLERHPDVALRIISSVWSDEFDPERFDMDIQYGSGRWPAVSTHRLTWETLLPVCSPDLLSGPIPLQTPGDLRNHVLLHVLGYEEGWSTWLRAAGVADINPGQGLQFDTSIMAFELAARGCGIALGRSSMTSPEIAAGRLVAPFGLAVPVEEAFYLISSHGDDEHPDAEIFRRWLLAETDQSAQVHYP